MSSNAIEELGKRIVFYGRDEGIQASDLRHSNRCLSKAAERWRAAAALPGGALANIVVSDCIDLTLYEVLYAMDDPNLLHLLFTTPRGDTVDWSVIGWGEPVGWYIGTDGWRNWYSKERFIDDFADVPSDWGVATPERAPNLDEMDTPRRAVEELGQLLIPHVRDVAIQSCDMQLLPHSQTAVAKRWRRAAIPFNGQVPPQVLIPDCVDEAIYAFLRAIDQGLLPLSYVSENGETVDLVKEGRGELAAQYMASDGWRAKYSKERINEDVGE